MMAKQSITIRADKLEFLDAMSDAQVAALFRAIKAYKFGDDVEPFLSDQIVKVMFMQVKCDDEKRIALTEIRREIGRLGGQASASKRKQNQAKPSKIKQSQAKRKQNQANAQPPPSQDDTEQKNDQNNENGGKTQNSCNSSNSVVVDNIILNNNQSKGEYRSDTIPFPEPPKPKKRRKAVDEDFKPPTLQEVMAVFRQSAAQLPSWEDEARIFFYHYDGLGWRNTHGVKIRNWDSFANKWIFDKINENKRKLSRQGDKRATTGIEPECGLIEP